MGLDIALGIMVLLGAVRGWFRGFLLQAVRLGSLVGAVFLAAPVRGLVRPYVAPHLATIRADLLDRMLWWASAVVTFLVIAGVLGGIVRLQRRRPYGDPESSRLDSLGGFLLAAGKASVVASFLVANLDRHAVAWIKSVPWLDEQVRDSMALGWERDYHPADRIWTAPPVQQFVAYVRRNGLAGDPPDLDEPARLLARELVAPAPPDAPPALPTIIDLEPTPAPAGTTASNTGDAPARSPRLGIARRPVSDPLPPPGASDEEVAARIDRAAGSITPP